MFLELQQLLQEQKYPLQKPRRTLQPKKLSNQVNELVFVNYNYRIRSSPSAGGLGMKYKVMHGSTLSGNWVKTLCQQLIMLYLQRNVFYLPQKFHCDVLKSNLNEQDCIQLIFAKDLSGQCHEQVTLADTAIY